MASDFNKFFLFPMIRLVVAAIVVGLLLAGFTIAWESGVLECISEP